MEPTATLSNEAPPSFIAIDAPLGADHVPVVSRRRVPLDKRLLDVVGAGLLLLSILPVLLCVAALVAVTSPGPVLYRQERFGLGGRRFTMLKFRTMHVDADAQLERLMRADPGIAQEMRETWKLRNDPRLTPCGSMLRRLSLDELPQLINVLRGDMSLVGPRPRRHRDEFRAYGDEVSTLFGVPPGLTGPWQVSGRNQLPEHVRAQLDLAYVRERSFLGDLKLLWRTIPVLLLPSRSCTS